MTVYRVTMASERLTCPFMHQIRHMPSYALDDVYTAFFKIRKFEFLNLWTFDPNLRASESLNLWILQIGIFETRIYTPLLPRVTRLTKARVLSKFRMIHRISIQNESKITRLSLSYGKGSSSLRQLHQGKTNVIIFIRMLYLKNVQ